MKRRTIVCLGLLVATLGTICPTAPAAGKDTFTATLRVDLGQDIGQNFGTLFEAHDSRGRIVAGAGFLGSYNTQARSDRRLVHFYVKPAGRIGFKPEALPRPTNQAGTYLFAFDNRLFSRPRGGTDSKLRVWDPAQGRWQVDTTTVPFSIHVGTGVLATTARGVTWSGHRVLELDRAKGALAELYYANACLCFRRFDRGASPPANELVACRWTSDQRGKVDISRGKTIPMRTPREFVYAWGQLGNQVVAATNTGGLYAFDGQVWKTVLEPDIHVSFQIYAMLNYRDRLLMGQYPTGELFSYDGTTLAHLEGAPPVMPGVCKQAREAQSLTIYGGDVYVGVWPWAEVWRLDSNRHKWSFMGRMFTHPKPTDATVHPYENQTKKLNAVLNRWGQRVTSLVPLGDALYISTSAKTAAAYEPKFTFLADGRWKEYGKVYRYRRSGCLTVPTRWKHGPTTFEFCFTGAQLTVRQDGKQLGTARFEARVTAEIASGKTRWGQGVFGKLRGTIADHNLSVTGE